VGPIGIEPTTYGLLQLQTYIIFLISSLN